jgi:hypothetical protein
MKKIKVLLLAANPVDTGTLRLGNEARAIFDQVEMGSRRQEFEIINQLAVRASDLQRILFKYEPDIVHFSGHGSKVGEIVLQDDLGHSKQVKKEALTRLFTLHKGNIRVVFLNACFSKDQATAISDVIDYTIGTNKEVGDNAAIVFAAAFYRALAFDRSVNFAFESAQAELDVQSIKGSDTPEFFVRKGVDKNEPFLDPVVEPREKVPSGLHTALGRLASGEATAEDASLIRLGLMEGKVILSRVEGAADSATAVLADLSHNLGSTTIRLELGETTYARFQEEIYPPPPGLLPPLPGLIFVGRENSLGHVKKLVGVDQPAMRDHALTVVRGWPGVGKTTLVGVLARDPEIAATFSDGVLWTALEQTPDLMSKIAAWGRSLGTDDLLRTPGLEEVTEKLSRLLRHKRILLIIDDIWNSAHALPFLRAAAGSSCSVLATTRLTSVAVDLASKAVKSSVGDNIYVLPVLTEDNALLLMRHLAPTIVEGHLEACRELVRDLEYLPLALHVAGRLLNEEAKLGLDILDLIQGIRDGAKLLPEPAPIDRAEGAMIPTVGALIKRSTDELDEQARECFAYLGVFAPKPATFDTEAMKAVWLIEDPKPLIRKLVGHGLLEPVGGGRFQMHALLVQHAASLLT